MRIGAQSAAARAKLESQQQLEVLKTAAKAEEHQDRMQAEGMRMGVDIAKTQEQMKQQGSE